MKRIGIAGLCLAMMVTVGAAGVTASAGAALPEFSGPFAKTFTSTTTGASRLRALSGKRVVCTAGTNSGEISGPKTGSVTFTFTGCALKKVTCSTPASAPGEIVTPVFAINIGYINKAKKTVGVDLTEPVGAPFLLFNCGTTMRVVALGSVIGKIKAVNTLVTPPVTFSLRFAQAGGKQTVTNLEGEPVDVLEASFSAPFEGAGFGCRDHILFGEPVTLKA